MSLFILGLCDPPDGGRGSEVEMRVMHPPVIVRTYQDTNPATSVLYWWAWPVAQVSMTVTYVRRLH
jgi:hypothetical protein